MFELILKYFSGVEVFFVCALFDWIFEMIGLIN